MRRSAAPSIGGLIFATVATLMFVPVVFSIIHGRRGKVANAGARRTACRLKPPPPSAVAPRALHRRRFGATVAAIIVVMGMTTRKMADAKLSEWTEKQAVPVVAVALPDTQGKKTTLDLPGRLEAYTQAQIYARVSGYLKEWKADIGTPVKAGDLLAEIDAPDLDQQIMQAEANLASAQANSMLSDATLQARPATDPVRRDIEAGPRSAGGRRLQQAGPGASRRRPISTACACLRNTSASSLRSMGWSPRAPPTSAR